MTAQELILQESTYETLVEHAVLRLGGTDQEPKNLRALSADIKVTKLPERRGKALPLDPKDKARVNVAFASHDFGTKKEVTQTEINYTEQASDVFILVSVAATTLYGPVGALKILEIATKLLINYEFWGMPLEAYSTDLVNLDVNVWYYQVFLRIRNFPFRGIDDFFNENEANAVILRSIDLYESECAPVFEDSEGSIIDVEGKDLISQRNG